MSRLPALAFSALVVATVGAFFVTQHLKVTTPLIATPRLGPAVINPLDGTICNGVNDRFTKLSFYLLDRSDDVDVWVVDHNGDIVSTLTPSPRHVPILHRVPFIWNGRVYGGRVAPDGVYHFRVALIHQGRTFDVARETGPVSVTVKTASPHPVVESVSPQLIPQAGGEGVTIRYSGNESRGGTIVLYRTDLPGAPRVVKTFLTPWRGQTARWDGKIHQRPAPPGTYLVGIDVTDAACNTGHFPVVNPPPPGTTPHTGVTVRYLAAETPLQPVPTGSRGVVYVDSRQRPYRWTLTRAGAPEASASGQARQFDLSVPLPRSGAGLYELSITSGAYRTAVPLGASAVRPERVLVVLPALTWQGLNPVDDDGDGIPNTLQAGYPIRLVRPLVHGLPADIPDEGALLAYLDKSRRAYDLTTDLALVEGVGPALAGHAAVVLAGSERWVPSSLRSALRSYVLNGGHVLSLGLDSLRRGVVVRGEQALDPTPPAAADALGAITGPAVSDGPGLITAARDALGIFRGTSGALGGLRVYEPIKGVIRPGQILSEALTSTGEAPIVGYRLGRGIVVDFTLVGFASSLARNFDAQQLLGRIWTVLSG